MLIDSYLSWTPVGPRGGFDGLDDAGKRQSGDDGEVYDHGKSVRQLKNMVVSLVEIPTFKSLDSSTHKGHYYK